LRFILGGVFFVCLFVCLFEIVSPYCLGWPWTPGSSCLSFPSSGSTGFLYIYNLFNSNQIVQISSKETSTIRNWVSSFWTRLQPLYLIETDGLFSQCTDHLRVFLCCHPEVPLPPSLSLLNLMLRLYTLYLVCFPSLFCWHIFFLRKTNNQT
jgi:hypothetical protein